MASDWQETALGDVADIKHGFAFKGEFIKDDPEGDVLLTPGNFAIGGGFKGETFKYYVGQAPQEFVLREGDLLVTMTDLSKQADTLGLPAVVPARSDSRRYLHNQRLGKVVVTDRSLVEVGYLHYLLRTPAYRNEVLASATGTTVRHTSPARIRQFRFKRPSLAEQRAIAHILGTLDDKIELNRRMSETLEAMARALFQSWFVDFDPVRAMVDKGARHTALPSDVASLFPETLDASEAPSGWRVVSLPDAIDVNPARTLRKGDVAPYLDMANMPTRGHTPSDVVLRPFGSGMRFRNGDTLVARITPCLENGKTAFVDFLAEDEVGWGSTEFIVLRPKAPLPSEFAYCLARGERFREFAIQSMTGSSGRQRVPAEALSHYRIAVPPAPVAEAFGRAVSPLFRRASQASVESRTLAALRDTLLPKLISGDLRVKDAERFVRQAT